MNADAFRYDGKRALVVGGATGMGAATARLVAELGGEVLALDRAEVDIAGVAAGRIDLADRDSINAAVDAIDGPIHALFMCAGVADGTPGIERINFIGHRHLIDRAIERSLLPHGSAIGFISSTAGLGWEADWDLLDEYLATPDWDGAMAWIEAHPKKADYMWSKQAVCGYVAREAVTLLARGIRVNATLPGPTVTPLAEANADLWLEFGNDYRSETGIEPSTPDEQAAPVGDQRKSRFRISESRGPGVGCSSVGEASGGSGRGRWWRW